MKKLSKKPNPINGIEFAMATTKKIYYKEFAKLQLINWLSYYRLNSS